MHRLLTIVLAAVVAVRCLAESSPAVNHNYMWFDCEANYATLSHPDSIRFYLEKVKSLGFGNVVVDVKSIMGEVLYDSSIAPYMSPFDGVERSRSYDMMGYFISYGHQMGLKVFASLNVFCGGHNFMKRGIIYGEKPQWQSICYDHGRLVPISGCRELGYNGMLNPSDPQVQEYEMEILKEFVSKYPQCDGLIFDRLRYDGITSDFSDLSRSQFEAHLGRKVENFPEDILSWYWGGRLRKHWKRGPLFNEWCRWRAGVIHDFVSRAHSELKAINPGLIIGDYTGAWYPTYYQLGVNWASQRYDPSAEYDWATPDYRETGYAELLDVYMTGLYYSFITKEDVDNSVGRTWSSGEAALNTEIKYCYSVEGGAEMARRITCGAVPVVGSIYVEQYLGDMGKFPLAVEQSLKSTGGVMVFDIVHLGKHGLWDDLEKAMRRCGQIN